MDQKQPVDKPNQDLSPGARMQQDDRHDQNHKRSGLGGEAVGPAAARGKRCHHRCIPHPAWHSKLAYILAYSTKRWPCFPTSVRAIGGRLSKALK
jgi:hypothetical protein